VEALTNQIALSEQGFIQSMDDDFNSAGALASLFELVRVINQTRSDGATDEQLTAAQQKLLQLTSVLGLTLQTTAESEHAADGFIDLLIEIRKDLRAHKLWDLSDKVRDRLSDLGVVLEDSREGTSWHWK